MNTFLKGYRESPRPYNYNLSSSSNYDKNSHTPVGKIIAVPVLNLQQYKTQTPQRLSVHNNSRFRDNGIINSRTDRSRNDENSNDEGGKRSFRLMGKTPNTGQRFSPEKQKQTDPQIEKIQDYYYKISDMSLSPENYAKRDKKENRKSFYNTNFTTNANNISDQNIIQFMQKIINIQKDIIKTCQNCQFRFKYIIQSSQDELKAILENPQTPEPKLKTLNQNRILDDLNNRSNVIVNQYYQRDEVLHRGQFQPNIADLEQKLHEQMKYIDFLELKLSQMEQQFDQQIKTQVQENQQQINRLEQNEKNMKTLLKEMSDEREKFHHTFQDQQERQRRLNELNTDYAAKTEENKKIQFQIESLKTQFQDSIFLIESQNQQIANLVVEKNMYKSQNELLSKEMIKLKISKGNLNELDPTYSSNLTTPSSMKVLELINRNSQNNNKMN